MMTRYALFPGLVIDENGQVVEVSYVGDEPCYVVNDGGFRRHIPAKDVDHQILDQMKSQISGNEKLLSEQTAKMLGQDDIFTLAMIENQLSKIDENFENLMQTGIPEEGRAYMGMMGFRIIINVHGDVIRLEQPSQGMGDDGE